MVQVDLSGAQRFFTQAGPDFAAVARAHDVLTSGSGLGLYVKLGSVEGRNHLFNHCKIAPF